MPVPPGVQVVIQRARVAGDDHRPAAVAQRGGFDLGAWDRAFLAGRARFSRNNGPLAFDPLRAL